MQVRKAAAQARVVVSQRVQAVRTPGAFRTPPNSSRTADRWRRALRCRHRRGFRSEPRGPVLCSSPCRESAAATRAPDRAQWERNGRPNQPPNRLPQVRHHGKQTPSVRLTAFSKALCLPPRAMAAVFAEVLHDPAGILPGLDNGVRMTPPHGVAELFRKGAREFESRGGDRFGGCLGGGRFHSGPNHPTIGPHRKQSRGGVPLPSRSTISL